MSEFRHIFCFLWGMAIMLIMPGTLCAQKVITTYYDEAESKVMERYELKKGNENIIEGNYQFFYKNGMPAAEGKYFNNEPVGFWKYYYENGQIKMQGEIINRVNAGLWQYFYPSGKPKMQGELKGDEREGEWLFFHESGELKASGSFLKNKRQGQWKFFYENGKKKSEIDFSRAYGSFRDFYENGSLKGEGQHFQGKRTGFWTLYHQNGKVAEQGKYDGDLKEGLWQQYDSNGFLAAEGDYENGEKSGGWKEYFDNGIVRSNGAFIHGEREGSWSFRQPDGAFYGTAIYSGGHGQFVGKNKKGNITAKGQLVGGQFEGIWEYYDEEGKVKASCHYKNGEGRYNEYYQNGALRLSGMLVNGLKTGVWVLYDQDAAVAGYYHPKGEEGELIAVTLDKVEDSMEEPPMPRVGLKPDYRYKKKGSRYFLPRLNEFRGFILSASPINTLVGELPISLEYYIQERMGIQVTVSLERDPFYGQHEEKEGVVNGLGYAIGIRQKFYQPRKKYGMLYFAHEIKYHEITHTTNGRIPSGQTLELQVLEQRLQYSLLVGDRIIFEPNGPANKYRSGVRFSLDWYMGVGVGPRFISRNYDESADFEQYFSDITDQYFPITFRFGVDLGFVF